LLGLEVNKGSLFPIYLNGPEKPTKLSSTEREREEPRVLLSSIVKRNFPLPYGVLDATASYPIEKFTHTIVKQKDIKMMR
jgi:hypothetical protein